MESDQTDMEFEQTDSAPDPKWIRAYVIMRNDLTSLGAGKAAAHAHHAGTQMVWWIQKHGSDSQKALLDLWMSQADGAGTTIVLEADDETMKHALAELRGMEFATGVWRDPTYPSTLKRAWPLDTTTFLVPMDVCGWALVDMNKIGDHTLFSTLPLMRNMWYSKDLEK